jgi:EAL domain-containing protein (putative c-di-GMP-specific phosphodiesterase class I)
MESAMQIGRERGLNMSGFLHKPVLPETLRELLTPFQPARKLLAKDLADGISADQLFLEYQLKFNCRLSRMTGAEALVRWRHPIFGIIQPDQFIALAEESHLIDRLTDWVVIAAAKQITAWNAQRSGLEVSINISPKNLDDLDFPDRIHRYCQEARADSKSITLEVTETGAMREAVQMMDTLTRLRLKGFMLSIDDFGTGYSSLVQLQRMPFSEVKIDKSFVMQMTHNQGCTAIVEIIVDLARKLGLKSVAEGVEDEAALRRLCALGCDTVQGFHLSSPIAAEAIPALVSEYRLMRVKQGASKTPKAPRPSPFTNARAWRRSKQSALPVMLHSGPIAAAVQEC